MIARKAPAGFPLRVETPVAIPFRPIAATPGGLGPLTQED